MTRHTRPTRNHKRAWWTLAVFIFATLATGAAHHAHTAASNNPTGAGSSTASTGDSAVELQTTFDRTSVLLGQEGLLRMELVLRARRAAGFAAPEIPTDLVVVLDRSGSMNGDKIRDARAAIHQLMALLTPADRFSLVTFSSGADMAIPLAHAVPAARASWKHVVDGIFAGGGTQMSTGLDLGIATLESARSAGRASRAIIISDGLAAEPHPVLRAQAARASAAEFTLSAVGVGADFDETLMGALADAGTGNYYYLDDTDQLAAVFASEFATARETVASALAVTVDPGADVQVVDAAGYPLEHSGNTATFRPGTLYAGQERRVWITLRVPTDETSEYTLGSIRVGYRSGDERRRLTLDDFPKLACVGDEKRFFADLDADTWAQAVVVDEYNQLRQSVAGLVKGGRKSEALAEIERFRSRNFELNRVVASPEVAGKLDAAEELEADVSGAFVGADAARKQNLLGKALHAEGGRERRVGSRK